jgi:putative flippase GtrA
MITEVVAVKLLKFMLIGIGGTILDFGITYLLKEKAKINKYLANSIGFMSASTSNYIFNRIWAFENTNPDIIKQYLIFATISLIGLALLNLFIWIFHEKFKINFYLSKVIALFIVLVWTFSAHYLITFSDINDPLLTMFIF